MVVNKEHMKEIVGLRTEDGDVMLQFTEYVACLASCSRQYRPMYICVRTWDDSRRLRSGEELDEMFLAKDWEQAFGFAKLIAHDQPEGLSEPEGGLPIVIVTAKGDVLSEAWLK